MSIAPPFSLRLLRALFAVAVLSHEVDAQLPVTRDVAVRAALATGGRVALARADTAAAVARLITARTLPNPVLGASYSKSAPTKHVSIELPLLDAFRTRGARTAQASASARAARLMFASERVAALVEVDTTYTQALAAYERFRLSRQTALDADSLRVMTERRRDAGDASDLDVDLASVVAGQQFNIAVDDSLAYMSMVLTVQVLMGLSADSVSITLIDSLALSAADTTAFAAGTGATGAPAVAAARATLDAADSAVVLQHRSAFALPALSLGAEFGDPDMPGLLPVIGFTIPLPLFDRNRGPVAEARADRERARVQLTVAQLEARRRIVEGTRERTALIAKVARDAALVVRAQRVSTRALTAYREGASALPAVLETRRNAREVLGQYIDDLAALLVVNTELRALTQPAAVP